MLFGVHKLSNLNPLTVSTNLEISVLVNPQISFGIT